MWDFHLLIDSQNICLLQLQQNFGVSVTVNHIHHDGWNLSTGVEMRSRMKYKAHFSLKTFTIFPWFCLRTLLILQSNGVCMFDIFSDKKFFLSNKNIRTFSFLDGYFDFVWVGE